MRRLRVLVVDDSVIYRSQIRNALADLPWIEITGVASNGRLALERIQLVDVDLVILDLEMPEMNGMELLREMKSRNLVIPVLVFSSASKGAPRPPWKRSGLGRSTSSRNPGPMPRTRAPFMNPIPQGGSKVCYCRKSLVCFQRWKKTVWRLFQSLFHGSMKKW